MTRTGMRKMKRRGGNFPYKKRNNNRSDMDDVWKHDLCDGDNSFFQKNKKEKPPLPQFGCKVIVSNLKFDILEDELMLMFGKFGNVLAVKVHYDNTGRSTGEADVVFKTKKDAEEAINEFNDRTMKSGQQLSIRFGGRTTVRDGIITSPRKDRDNRGGGRNNRRDGRNDNRRNYNRRGGGGRKGGDNMVDEDNFTIQVNY